jgi:hypothetical protein
MPAASFGELLHEHAASRDLIERSSRPSQILNMYTCRSRQLRSDSAHLALILCVACFTRMRFPRTTVCLRPDLVLSQMGGQLCEIEGSVNFLILYVAFNLGKLLNEDLAVLAKVLTGGHTLSLLR